MKPGNGHNGKARRTYWRDKANTIRKELEKGNKKYEYWSRKVLAPWEGDTVNARPPGERIVYDSSDSENENEMPGVFPFTRGIYPNMYNGRPWTMRMFSGFSTPEDTNKRLKYLLKHGETGLSIAFDEPTLYGIDCDNPRTHGEIGKCGVNVTSLKDMEVLFDGIPLGDVSTSMTINAPALIIFAMYLAIAKKRGIPLEKLSGTLQADILKEYIAQKEWIYPPEAHLRMIRDIMLFCIKKVPKWNFISVSGYHIREAGATAAQELAFTLADGFYYVDMGMAAKLPVDKFAPRISFFFDSGINFFEEIAKFRAARRIWANVLIQKYHAEDQRSLKLRFHTQTSGYTLTWQQPLNNISRTAIEAMAAVLGGTQSLHTNSYDEALALPTEHAAHVALRTQQIIADETGVMDVVDPLGGSYYLEYLTKKMEMQAYDYFDKIEAMGGILQAIKNGYPQKEIANSAYERQKRLETGKEIMVGVNKYMDANEKQINILKISKEAELIQKKRIKEVKRQRNTKKIKSTLDALRKAMKTESENLVPYVIDAVLAYATIGEIVEIGREIYGEWKEPEII